MIIYTGNYEKRRKRLLVALLRRDGTTEEMQGAMQERITQLWHNRHHQSKRVITCRLCNDFTATNTRPLGGQDV